MQALHGLKIGLILLLAGCTTAGNLGEDFQIYRNGRYGFEFPYPSQWRALPSPINQDGQAFQNPDHPNVEIRGWAKHQLFPTKPILSEQNFTTEQGLTGQLQVEIQPQTSFMTLTLIQEQRVYYWQGRSPSHEFAEYYPLFETIARQYHILSPKGSLK